MLDILRSIARAVTPIALDVYDRIRGTGSIADLAEEMPHDGSGDKGEIEFVDVFPQMREWVGDRETQGAFQGKLDYEIKAYEATSSYDRRKIELGNPLAEQAIQRFGQKLGEAFQFGKKRLVYQVLRDNPVCSLDGQNLFDTDHPRPDGTTVSNLLTVGADVPARGAEGLTASAAKREIQHVINQLATNSILTSEIIELDDLMDNLIVITRSFEAWKAFVDLAKDEKVDGQINRFRGQVKVSRDLASPVGIQGSYDIVWATPGGPRPVIFIPAREPQGVQFDESQVFRNKKIDFGMDSLYGVAPGFWHPVVRVAE